MITPPTDRLHKFLAVGGLCLFLIGVIYPIEKYNQAEIERINTNTKLNEAKFSIERFEAKITELKNFRLRYSDRDGNLKKNIPIEDFILATNEILKNIPEFQKEVDSSIVSYGKQIELNEHYEFIKKVWFTLGGLCIIIGGCLAYVGFKQWLSQPKSSR
jgi:hypothetical protein